MEFGVFSNGQRLHEPERSYELDLDELVTADALGFEEAWISEHTGHHWLPFAVPAPELLICKAAALTRRIRMGAAVRRIALYPPQMMAIEAALTDHLTGGRYNFGFGIGPPVTNYSHWGIDIAHAGAMTAEAIDLIERCWRGREPFDFRGEFFSGSGIDIYPRPLQRRIPVAVASGNEQMLALAADRDWRVLTTWSHRADAVRRIGEAFDAACRARHGATRRRALTACRAVYVAPTDRQAHDDVAANFAELIEFNRKHLEPGAAQYATGPKPPPMTFESMLASGNVIVGSPGTVVDAVRALYREVGGFGTFLLVAGRDFATPPQVEAMLRLFAREVRPALEQLDSGLDGAVAA